MGKMLNIENTLNKKKENYFKIRNEDIHFLVVFFRALSDATSATHAAISNKDFDPIFFYGLETYDPYMMNRWQVEFFCEVPDDGAGLSWPGVNGIERTRIFLEYVDTLTKRYIGDMHNTFYCERDPIRTFWFTKETLTDNSIIINILHVPDKTFKRILVTDVKAVCELLYSRKGDFSKVLGEDYTKQKPEGSKRPTTMEEVNALFDEELKQILPYLEDGSDIEIQDENVYEILKYFGFFNTYVVSMPHTSA